MNDEQSYLLGIPSGKSLEQPTLELLKSAHIEVRRGHPRQCLADVSGVPGIRRAVFVKPAEIPALVSRGKVPIALTGKDAVLESGVGGVQIVAELSFSRATPGGTRAVLFAREDDDARSIKDMEGQHIVSEYPRETRTFFDQESAFPVVEMCSGSVEALVVIGRYRFGVALVETGTSLRVNGLREIATIFLSQTVLVVNAMAYAMDEELQGTADFLGNLLRGVLEARDKVYLLMNVPASAVEVVCEKLPALKTPTVQSLADANFCSVASVVPAAQLNQLKLELSRLGASGFVEFDPGSVM